MHQSHINFACSLTIFRKSHLGVCMKESKLENRMRTLGTRRMVRGKLNLTFVIKKLEGLLLTSNIILRKNYRSNFNDCFVWERKTLASTWIAALKDGGNYMSLVRCLFHNFGTSPCWAFCWKFLVYKFLPRVPCFFPFLQKYLLEKDSLFSSSLCFLSCKKSQTERSMIFFSVFSLLPIFSTLAATLKARELHVSLPSWELWPNYKLCERLN